MKRFFAVLIALALLLAIPIVSSEAATAELGEMLIASEKVSGQVGDVLKVNFFLYPNLPDGRKLDSLSGSMKYDPEFVTLGAINQTDEENNLTSLMKGKASSFQSKIEDSGVFRFAFIDAYGVEKDGFWFQAEFRIEKEGATDFIFNGIQYTGIDDDYKTVSFYIEPVSVGGIYTEGETVPEDGAAGETFEPLEPVIDTPVPVTPTPKPSNNAQPVPVVSTLPTVDTDAVTGNTGIVTPPPAVTSMPVTTPVPQGAITAVPAGDPSEQANDPVAEGSQAPDTDPGTEGNNPDQPSDPSKATSIPIVEEPTGSGTSTNPKNPSKVPSNGNGSSQTNSMLVVGIVIGIVAVLGLGALAIVLVLKRRKMDE